MLCRKILTLKCFDISSGSSVILSGRSRKEKVYAHSYKTSGTTCQNSRTEGMKMWKIWKCAKQFRYQCKPVPVVSSDKVFSSWRDLVGNSHGI